MLASSPSFEDARPSHPQRTWLNRYEWAGLLFGLLIAHLFMVRSAATPLAYDDYDYAMAGRSILEGGLFSKFYGSEVRTYGYPLFLSLVHGLSDAISLPLKWVAFEIQLSLYFLSAAFLRRELLHRHETLTRAVFCATAVNFYALLYTTEILTESLSASVLLIAAASWLRLQRNPSHLMPFCLGSIAAAAAVMIRPANLFLLGSWIMACAIVLGPFFLKRRAAMSAFGRIAVFAAIACAILLPQWTNNVRNWQSNSPLVATDLQLLQQELGIRYLKYATALPPSPQPEVYYENPLLEGTTLNPAAPASWYAQHPFRGALTIGLHLFNMTDQDLLFTYASDLRPWFRVPHGLVNHGVVALGLLGLFVFWRNTARRGTRTEIESGTAVALLILSNAAIYAMTAVEMRFGLTLLLVLFPSAAYGFAHFTAVKNDRTRLALAGAITTYVTAALLLSTWIRSQSPQIGLN